MPIGFPFNRKLKLYENSAFLPPKNRQEQKRSSRFFYEIDRKLTNFRIPSNRKVQKKFFLLDGKHGKITVKIDA